MSTWYVLAADGETERLMKCTADGHEALALRPTDPPIEPLDHDGPRMAPSDATNHVDDSAPRATRVVNDLHTEWGDTESYLRRLGESVSEALQPHDDGPLYLAMDEDRAALFETVGKQPVAGLVEPHSTERDLWELTKRMELD
jgi:hypothetical protein